MSAPVLQCRDLRKAFGGRPAVDGVSFEIPAGQTYGLLGPNGAGKTTTISMICGLQRRDGGHVAVCGHPVDGDAVAAKSLIGYVPQDIALYPDLSGTENLRFFGRLYGLAGGELSSRVEEVLEVVGLSDRSGDRVSTYSGGMQRRLNIAAGLLHRPKLLVLDEPTVGVDPQSRNSILESVEKLSGEGTAVLYTTHYMEEAERLCDRVGIIDHGRLLAEGTRRELVELTGSRDRVDITADGSSKRFAASVRRMKAVSEVSDTDDGISVLVEDGRRLLPKLLDSAARTGLAVTGVRVVEPDLEGVFLHLTGRALRD